MSSQKHWIVVSFDGSDAIGYVHISRHGVEHDYAEFLAYRAFATHASQREDLLLHLDQALDGLGFTLKDVDAFAVGVGPGSFTGTRIAVVTANTLALTLHKPLIGLSRLALLNQPYRFLLHTLSSHGMVMQGYGVANAFGGRVYVRKFFDISEPTALGALSADKDHTMLLATFEEALAQYPKKVFLMGQLPAALEHCWSLPQVVACRKEGVVGMIKDPQAILQQIQEAVLLKRWQDMPLEPVYLHDVPVKKS